jgi:hypothetical protein
VCVCVCGGINITHRGDREVRLCLGVRVRVASVWRVHMAWMGCVPDLEGQQLLLLALFTLRRWGVGWVGLGWVSL